MRFARPGKLRLERGLKITRGKRVVKETRAHPAAFLICSRKLHIQIPIKRTRMYDIG